MRILDEFKTLAELKNRSIARYGDGELKLCLKRDCVSQVYTPELAKEMRKILLSKNKCLVGIPRVMDTMPSIEFWKRYRDSRYTLMYDQKKLYGSSFITRPDNAPHINTEEYWTEMENLWKGKDVTLVVGSRRSFMPHMFPQATSVRVVVTPRRDAHAQIDRLMEEIGRPAGVVILASGASATCMAARLDEFGVHAIDLGHAGTKLREKYQGLAKEPPVNLVGEMPVFERHPNDIAKDLEAKMGLNHVEV